MKASRRLFDVIDPGDRVTIVTPHGQKRTGTARIKNEPAGVWVLNMGGANGTPALATPENIVHVRKGAPDSGSGRAKKQKVDTPRRGSWAEEMETGNYEIPVTRQHPIHSEEQKLMELRNGEDKKPLTVREAKQRIMNKWGFLPKPGREMPVPAKWPHEERDREGNTTFWLVNKAGEFVVRNSGLTDISTLLRKVTYTEKRELPDGTDELGDFSMGTGR